MLPWRRVMPPVNATHSRPCSQVIGVRSIGGVSGHWRRDPQEDVLQDVFVSDLKDPARFDPTGGRFAPLYSRSHIDGPWSSCDRMNLAE